MIEVKNIDPLALPFVPLPDHRLLPEHPSIYFAIDAAGVVQYIGQSINLRQRWSQHHRFNQLKVLGGIRIAYLSCDVDLLWQIEEALIAYFQPVLNGQAAPIQPIDGLSGLVNTLDVFLAKKGVFTAYRFHKDTGLSIQTARKLLTERTAYPEQKSTVAKICKTYDAQPGEFLAYMPDEQANAG